MKPTLPTRLNLLANLRAGAVQILCNTFARAFDVKAPNVMHASRYAKAAKSDALGGTRPDLYAFREFSAACMEAALESPAYAAVRKERLRELAFELGTKVRRALRPSDRRLPSLIRLLYSSIGIDVECTVPGSFTFRRCYFSERYTPELCDFMSAFDDGFVSGLCGGGSLVFSARIPEGCPCCLACFSQAISIEREDLV